MLSRRLVNRQFHQFRGVKHPFFSVTKAQHQGIITANFHSRYTRQKIFLSTYKLHAAPPSLPVIHRLFNVKDLFCILLLRFVLISNLPATRLHAISTMLLHMLLVSLGNYRIKFLHSNQILLHLLHKRHEYAAFCACRCLKNTYELLFRKKQILTA